MLAPGGVDEGWGYLNAAATEVAQVNGVVGTVTRGVTRGSKTDGTIEMGAARDESGRKRRKEEKKGELGAPEVTVMASGCLGLVSFPHSPGRATLEQLNLSYPKLVEGLRTHPGIGFMLIRSEQHGAAVLGPGGANYLDEGRVEGDDPLAPYGGHAALHVKRTDTFPHCQDIMLNSTYWTDVDEVAAFEELCGSHGGMAAPRTTRSSSIPPAGPHPEQRSSAPRTSTSSSSTGSPSSVTPPTPTCQTCPTGSSTRQTTTRARGRPPEWTTPPPR